MEVVTSSDLIVTLLEPNSMKEKQTPLHPILQSHASQFKTEDGSFLPIHNYHSQISVDALPPAAFPMANREYMILDPSAHSISYP